MVGRFLLSLRCKYVFVSQCLFLNQYPGQVTHKETKEGTTYHKYEGTGLEKINYKLLHREAIQVNSIGGIAQYLMGQGSNGRALLAQINNNKGKT